MDVVPLEMSFEQNHRPVVHSAIDKVVDQQVDPHSGSHPENRGKTETHTVAAIEDCLFGFDFSAAVKRDWSEGRVLGAKLSLFADAVPAVGHRHHDALFAACKLEERENSIAIDGRGADFVVVAYRRADQGGQRNDEI